MLPKDNNMKPTLLVSCNIEYLNEHGYTFVNSAIANGHECVVYIVDYFNDNDTLFAAQDFIEYFSYSDNIEIRLRARPKHLKFPDELRTYYSLHRFLVLDEVVKQRKSVLVSDVDAIISKEILIDDNIDLGIYLREDNNIGANQWEIEGMKVAAGILYATDRAKQFTNTLKQNIENIELKWFCDQHAIYRTYRTFKDQYNILDFNGTNYIDWNFDNIDAHSIIYSAKGNRKSHPNYLRLKDQYRR